MLNYLNVTYCSFLLCVKIKKQQQTSKTGLVTHSKQKLQPRVQYFYLVHSEKVKIDKQKTIIYI